MTSLSPRVLFLGQVDFERSFAWMRDFTDSRHLETRDEIWALSHYPVFTQGTSCEALPTPRGQEIPVIKTDRGGQITYHGPGQLIIYLMLDIKRLGYGPKRLVRCLENSIIDVLKMHGLSARTRQGAPGVYIEERKIAALGLRIRNGMTYHGISLNIDMDLTPFNRIDPCGYHGLEVTQLSSFGLTASFEAVKHQLVDCLIDSIYEQN